MPNCQLGILRGNILSRLNSISKVLGLLACATISHTVSAHGWVEFPTARQVICYDDGGYWSLDGKDIPNAACKAAFTMSGTYPFIQKNEFAALTKDYNNIEAVKRQVPDGQLCSAGNQPKAGMSIASSQWQKTKIKLNDNGQIEMVFNATAPHNPSFWQFYITKPDYDHSQPLTWDDLELVDTAGNVPVDSDRKYRINVTLPNNRSGDAIIYTRWQRDDAAGEGFYNCSDVSFSADGETGGGDGGENPDPSKPYLTTLGYYIPVGYPTPNEGDYVSLRGFNEQGDEVLEERLLITTDNSYSWQEQLAMQVSDKHKPDWFIGIWHADMAHYMYDRNNVHANQVLSKQVNASFVLSIIEAEVPPVEPPIDPELPQGSWDKTATYIESNIVNHNSKSWQAHWWTKGDEPGTTGEWGVWREVAGTVDPELPEPPVTSQTWNAAVEYTENNMVNHNNQSWQAHWWTKGDEPGTTGEWGVWRLAN